MLTTTAILLAVLVCLPTLAVSFSATKNAPVANETAGKNLFERHCAVCHGVEGKGGRGPSLHRAELEHAPDDAALKSVISDGIAPSMPPFWFLTEEDIGNVVAYVRSLGKLAAEPLPGDAKRGATVFAKAGCSNCHIFAGSGNGFGPELTSISVQRSPSHIKQTIRRPGENLPEDFLMVQATTAKGENILGIRVNEDAFSVQIKDIGGRFYSLRKQDLKALEKLRGQTPMPNYEDAFTDSELDDLVAYLCSRGKP